MKLSVKDKVARRRLNLLKDVLWGAIEVDLDTIDKRLSEIEVRMSQHDDALNKLQGDLSADEADVAGIQSRESASDAQIAALQQEVSDLKTQAASIPADDTAAIEGANARLEALDAQLKALGVVTVSPVEVSTPAQPVGDANAPGVGVVPQG